MRYSKDSEGWGKGLLEWEAICPEWEGLDLAWDLELPAWDLKLEEWKLDIDWQLSPVIVQASGKPESLIRWGLDGNNSEINHYSILSDLGYLMGE